MSRRSPAHLRSAPPPRPAGHRPTGGRRTAPHGGEDPRRAATSIHQQAAVHVDDLAGQIAGIGREQERDDTCHLLRATDAAERDGGPTEANGPKDVDVEVQLPYIVTCFEEL